MAAPRSPSDPMISFDAGTHQFHYRGAAVILRGHSVLLHQLEGSTLHSIDLRPRFLIEALATAELRIGHAVQRDLAAP